MYNTEEGANMKLREDNREKLLTNQDNLHEGNRIIKNLEDTAIDTHKKMVDARDEVIDQGNLINKAEENVAVTGMTVDRTRRMVNQMSRKEYWYKFLLYVTIVLLFITDIAYFIAKIFNWGRVSLNGFIST